MTHLTINLKTMPMNLGPDSHVSTPSANKCWQTTGACISQLTLHHTDIIQLKPSINWDTGTTHPHSGMVQCAQA